jgi:Flp pilus assembly protein CpaB
MKKGRNVILLFISILSGITAAFFIVYYLNTYRSASVENTASLVKIASANTNIDIGESFTADNVTFVNWPKKDLPEGYLSALSDLRGLVAGARIPKGMPLTKGVTLSSLDNISSMIPQNYRAMSIDLTQLGGIPDFIEVGSYVDVIATFDVNTPNPISKTILQNVKVLKITRKSKEGNVDRDRLTLVMSVSDAEKLSLSMAKGSIRVTLRNQGDMDNVDANGIDGKELIWGVKSTAGDEKQAVFQLPKRETVEIIRGVEKKTETLRG